MTEQIIEATYMDYMFLFGGYRTALSDMYMKIAEKSGKIFLVMKDSQPAGFLCTEKNDGFFTVLYGFTIPKWRNQGIFTKLLNTAIENAAAKVRITVSENKECCSYIVRAAEHAGFKKGASCMVYQGKSEDFHNWEKYMERTGNKLCEILLRQGFTCVSFAKAGEMLQKKLYESKKNEFQNRLEICSYLENKEKNMEMNMSFMAVKDQEIAAYTLIRRPDPYSAVFEQISSHEKYQGSGCIMLPFAASMDMFKKEQCHRAAYAMYEDNLHANAFRKKMLGMVTSSKHCFFNYYYEKKEI